MSAEQTSGGGGLKGRVTADRATPAGERERKLERLVDALGTELIILRAGWFLADGNGRQRKQLTIGPAEIRRWSKLIRRAGRR